jgi:hypothetical protein
MLYSVQMVTRLVGWALLLASAPAAQLANGANAEFPRAFHVTGLPDVKRGQRVDIRFADDEVVFEHKATVHHAPFIRVKQVLLLHAARNYEKSTAAAAVVTGALGVPFGALMILQKHKVDSVVVDYENDRGGRMGLIVQLESGKGQEIGAMFTKHGVSVVDPPAEAPKKSKAKPDSTAEAR